MVRRTSRKQLAQEAEQRRKLAELRRTPRLICVQFRYADIEGPVRMFVSFNEEPEHTESWCPTAEYRERMKGLYRDVAILGFEAVYKQYEMVMGPWGEHRTMLDDFTPDYLDSYSAEVRGAATVEFIP